MLWLAFRPAAADARPPDFEGFVAYVPAMWEWMKSLGKPLGVGLVLLAVTLATLGYCAVRLAWRWHVVVAWRRRARRRDAAA